MKDHLSDKSIRKFTDGRYLFNFVSYSSLVIYCILILIPIYFILISSFKDNSTIYTKPLNFPYFWSFSNYLAAQERVNILGAMGNSILIALGSELAILILGFPCAFAMSRIPTRLTKIWESIFAAGFLIPGFAIMVPIFFLFFHLHLLLNPLSVILTYAGLRLPFTVVYLASQMRDIPREIEESAQIDGANWFQIMVHLFIPLSISSLVTIIIMNFIFAWNEYLMALILLSENVMTVQRVLPKIVDVRTVPYGILSAAIVISTIPIYIIFIIFQRQIMHGTVSGAVKS
jgi:ABC-type glycerol-3-phosphate transport system permease component